TITPGGPTTFCAGGSVTLTANSGASYSWSNGATTRAITVNASGNYHVTVTDANGCSATSADAAVTVNTPLTATITPSGPTTFCAGGSVTLTANSGASYAWSNGATTRAIAVNSSGNYHVTVTAVTANARPTATVSGGGTVCAGSSATVTATLTGLAPFSVTWSDGNVQNISSGTTASPSVPPAATTNYRVTAATDANCSGTS